MTLCFLESAKTPDTLNTAGARWHLYTEANGTFRRPASIVFQEPDYIGSLTKRGSQYLLNSFP